MYRAADLCYVNSLHDGMNLVAKEFVRARDDDRGVLVLSQFTGASRQLTAALSVSPYAPDESAQTLARALRMPYSEQTARMRQMRNVVAEFDSHWWARRILEDATALSDASDTNMTADGAVAQLHPSATSATPSFPATQRQLAEQAVAALTAWPSWW